MSWLRSIREDEKLSAVHCLTGLCSCVMLSSLKGRFDDSAAGAQYRYVKGWVEYGNPAKAYRELIYLLAAFADLADQHHIEYWLDWGSLLGFLRHDGGIIPCQSLAAQYSHTARCCNTHVPHCSHSYGLCACVRAHACVCRGLRP